MNRKLKYIAIGLIALILVSMSIVSFAQTAKVTKNAIPVTGKPMPQNSIASTPSLPATYGLVDYNIYYSPITGNGNPTSYDLRDWSFYLPSSGFVDISVSGNLYAVINNPPPNNLNQPNVAISIDNWGQDANTFRTFRNYNQDNKEIYTGFQTGKVYWLPKGIHTVHIWVGNGDGGQIDLYEISISATATSNGAVDVVGDWSIVPVP